MAKKTSSVYLCNNCGNEFSVWAGKCSACGEWNSLVEIKEGTTKSKSVSPLEITNLSDIEINDGYRIKTGISEFDRVLGGGIVPGSVILLGGEPGVGKSTLILQVADKVSSTFYVSAEESATQIKLRADRLKISGKIKVASEANIDNVLSSVSKIKPELLIIDSIQTVFTDVYNSTPGSIVQVRECGMILQQYAKLHNIPIIIIGHVTKEGNLAGPRILEHLVDAVLYLEGDRFSDARLLRGTKNRFGATNEVGIFSMQEKGMVEISNPSEMFLSESKPSPGSCITVTLEGARPILIEIQALAVPTHFGYPKRTSSGFDLNRLNLLAAVISKKTSINLANHDIYLNVIGGIKLNEPAVDLAVCAAIISSFSNKSLLGSACVFGEVGLLGEVRKVTRHTDRVKEATALGYKVLDNIKSIDQIIGLLGSRQ
ncbi:MAG: DNA repair protein RadA [Candidatus Berkelbacteria bacterium]